MLKIILGFYNLSLKALKDGVVFEKLAKLTIREKISRLKYIEEKNIQEFNAIEEELGKSYV